MTQEGKPRRPTPLQRLNTAYKGAFADIEQGVYWNVSPQVKAWVETLRPKMTAALTGEYARQVAILRPAEHQDVRAGLDGKWFHDTRRSFATRKIEEGWDRDHVKAITGHRQSVGTLLAHRTGR